MKVVFFIPTLESGGAEKVTSILCNQFISNGYEVELVLIKKVGPYLNHLHSNIKIVNLNKNRSLFCIFKFYKYIKQSKPDIIISALDNANIISAIVKKFFFPKIKLIITCHSTISKEFKYSDNYKAYFLKKLMKYTFCYAEKIIAVSNGVALDLKNILKIDSEKIKIIYNPVYSEDILELGKLENNFKWFHKEYKIFISIGRLTDVKNYELLIDSFNIVKDKINSKLIIIGEGPLRFELQNQIESLNLHDFVFLAGYLDNPYNWLSNSDVFVVSSKWEGLSCALIEAMSFNLNIVSSNCYSGPIEILENGKWGLIANQNNKEDLSNLMLKSILSPKLDHNKKRAKIFSINAAMFEYNKIINEFS